jgi:glycosyltransferase involved in cell wall biosynthesis
MSQAWRRFYILTERISALCSDVILSQNSEDIQTAIRERICKAQKIKYLGNGIDIGRFDPARLPASSVKSRRAELGLPEGAPVVGFVGRLVAEKGLLELFAAARLVRERVPDVHFLFVGPIEPDKADAVSPAAAEEYGIAQVCHFTGIRQDMPEMYALMDVFALPSHREGFPRAPMEASAMTVPCVVTDIRGCREAVEHGRNGLLVPLGDVEALAEAIVELLTDRDRAWLMGEEGRRLARERFDERFVFQKVLEEYDRFLRDKTDG